MTTRTLSRWLLLALSLTFCVPNVATAQLTEQLRSMRERRKAGEMLERARTALDSKNVELAEWYLDRIEKMDVDQNALSLRGGDNPAALRAQIAQLKTSSQLARALGEGESNAQPSPLPVPNQGPSANRLNPATQPPANLERPPVSSVARAVATEPAAEETPKARAQRMLARGWAALSEGDVNSAVVWYQHALSCEATFAEQEFSPEDLATEFRNRNIDLGKVLAANAETRRPPASATAPAATQAEAATPLQNPAATSVVSRKPASDQPGGLVDPALMEADKITSSRLLERGAKLLSAKDARDARSGTRKTASDGPCAAGKSASGA